MGDIRERVHIGELIKFISDELERQINNEMRPRDITMSQMRVLAALHDAPEGTLSSKQLETALGIAQSTAWGLVTRLEAKGFVEGLEDATDGRARLVRITDAGKNLCMDAVTEMERHEDQLTENLSAKEREQLADLLKRVYETILS